MTKVFLILLVISQLISFYFIILLFLKIGKFKNLEAKQNQLVQEMEEGITAYLMEIREENDRFIRELSQLHLHNNQYEEKNDTKLEKIHNSKEKSPQNPEKQEKEIAKQSNMIPKALVVSTYNRQNATSNEHDAKKHLNDSNKEKKLSFEDQVLQLYEEGKSIEDIAKITKKGKTEIELLLKFHA